MNIKTELCVSRDLLPTITLHLTKQNPEMFTCIRNWQCNTHGGPLGEKLDFVSPLGFDIQRHSDHETPKIKLYSVRALKRYLQ